MMKEKYVKFVCPRCGRQKVEARSFDSKCACGEDIRRYTITFDNSMPEENCNIDALEAYHPRLSYSMAISPNQLQEAMKLWPESEYVPNKTGDMLLLKVNSRKDKHRKMKQRNMVEIE